MIDENYKIFNLFNKKIRKINNYNDIIILFNYLTRFVKSDSELRLMESLITNNLCQKKINDEEFTVYIGIINETKFPENILEIIENLMKSTDDQAQLNTLRRILNKKGIYPEFADMLKKEKKIELIQKTCPHCGKECSADKDTDYIVCGYSIGGFDWLGCGYDWCFQCGKKLCKSWHLDNLFDKTKRYHNNKCCRNYAKYISDKYPDNYCMCGKNKYVQR